jgi:hypothetical protein
VTSRERLRRRNVKSVCRWMPAKYLRSFGFTYFSLANSLQKSGCRGAGSGTDWDDYRNGNGVSCARLFAAREKPDAKRVRGGLQRWVSLEVLISKGVNLRDFSPEGSCAYRDSRRMHSASRQMLRKLSMTHSLRDAV